MLVVGGVLVGLLLLSLGITATRQALGPDKQWYEYLLPSAFAILAIVVGVLVLR